MAYYKLNADTSCINALTTGLDNLTKSLEEIIKSANEKYSDLIDYAAADPVVSVSLDNGCLSQIGSSVATDQANTLANIKNILAAIDDYQDGNWSSENKKVIDDFLANNKPRGGGPGGGPGGVPVVEENGISDDNLLANELEQETIQSTIPLSDMTTTTDEEIVLGQTAAPVGQYNAEAVVPFANSGDETLNIESDGVEGESSNLGTSLLGNSSFVVPSTLGSNGKVDDIKGAGVLGAAGIAAAAAAAIGGKVFYDKKHNENEEDAIDDDIARMNEESGSDVNNGFMSGLNSVDFKSELLNEMDGDE